MIIAGVAIAHGGEGAGVFAQLIVGIDASLQGVEPFGLILRMLLEGFHMIEAHIAAERELWRELEILSDAIEQGAGEFLVQAEVMGADA